MKKLLLMTSTLLFCLGTFAQVESLPHAKKRAVYGNGYYVNPSEYNYEQVAKDITQGTESKYEQAKLIYLWLCANISYDLAPNDVRSADKAWTERKAVCQGYCELFYRMAETLKLKTDLVYGRGRNSKGHMEDHSWLTVKTEQGEILMDPTWGAGSVVNGKFQRIKDPLVWFDVDPETFIHTHLPQNKKHQHLKVLVTEEGFDSLEYVRPTLKSEE